MTAPLIKLRPIDRETFRDVLDLETTPAQSAWVATPARYLAICTYEGVWHPLGLYADAGPVGFAMWARDPDDGSYWIGGFLIDRHHQGRGLGRAAMEALIAYLSGEVGAGRIALSYSPDNDVARRLYASLGFIETGEMEGSERVARLRVSAAGRGDGAPATGRA